MNALTVLPPIEDAVLSPAEAAYRQLRDKLIMLEIRPGEPINDGQLAAELRYGRTPVREAIKRLEIDHLVVSYPRRGTFATMDPGRAESRDLMRYDLTVHRLIYKAAANPRLEDTLIRYDNLATLVPGFGQGPGCQRPHHRARGPAQGSSRG